MGRTAAVWIISAKESRRPSFSLLLRCLSSHRFIHRKTGTKAPLDPVKTYSFAPFTHTNASSAPHLRFVDVSDATTPPPRPHGYYKSARGLPFSLYKILFHFKALLWESTIHLPPPPPTKPTLLQYYGITIALRPPTDPSCVCHTPYNIGDCNIV